MFQKKITHTLCAATLAGFSLTATAQAVIGSQLDAKLDTLAVTDKVMVITTFNQLDPVSSEQLSKIMGLGITEGVQFQSLPMVGVLATPLQIEQMAQMSDVRSIFLNRQLQYFNGEAREITGVEKLQSNQFFDRNGFTYTGKGVTVMVNDSGIDGTVADLEYGSKVVQNVQGLTHAQALSLVGVPGMWLENQINTDLNSGHGTHCAGTLGGWGTLSNGLYKGAATDVEIVGYGSGATLAMLDALGGYDYAITHLWDFNSPIRVMSNSWGSSGAYEPDGPVSIASYKAYKLGLLSVFAAGNSGPGEDTHNPYAQIPWGMSVGAGTKDGKLIDFSSRGKRGETGTFTMPDGVEWTYNNEVTIVAPGVDIISTRAKLNGAANGGDADVGVIAPEHLPFYTMISGTSMATPHVAGIIAMMLEANPNLQPLEIKRILTETATNMPGYERYEVGAGYVNAHSAIAGALIAKDENAVTVNNNQTFNANAVLVAAGDPIDFEVFYSPVGTPEEFEFEVGDDVAWVSAASDTFANTTKLKLTAPDGTEYFGNLSLPVLETGMRVSAPAQAGTWKLSGYGLTSLAGVQPDPLGVTNGPGLPEIFTGQITMLKSGGYTGIGDTQGHPLRNAIEYAVSERLMDGFADGSFRPDRALKRRELAQYLVMGAAVRQYRAFANEPMLETNDAIRASERPFAEAVFAQGGALKDRTQTQDSVMQLKDGNYAGNARVTREELAYSLVQALGLEEQAKGFEGSLTVDFRGERVPVLDSDAIAPELQGYVQQAIDLGLLNVRFDIEQGAFDPTPRLVAYFEPTRTVTRAEYALRAGQFMDYYFK